MDIQFRIDNAYHRMDSCNPELISAWMIEKICEHEWTPVTYASLTINPTYGRQVNLYLAGNTLDEKIDILITNLKKWRDENASNQRGG